MGKWKTKKSNNAEESICHPWAAKTKGRGCISKSGSYKKAYIADIQPLRKREESSHWLSLKSSKKRPTNLDSAP